MAFIGQETVRKQQRHNLSWGMYTLIAVFVHFNHFIDLKINFHTDPYNLASSRLLWFWAPCGVSTAIFSPIRGIRIPDCRVESGIRSPESWALESRIQLKESRIPLTTGIRNPRRGIQYPRLFWIPLRWQRFLAQHSFITFRCESSRVTSPLNGAIILWRVCA